MLKKLCNASGCYALIDMGDRYCSDHADVGKTKESDRQRYYDIHQRDQRSKGLYESMAWRRIRLVALDRDNYLCVMCLKDKKITQADMVDHIIPVKVNWELRLALSNLQSLCDGCHAIKTADDKRKYNL